MSKIPIKNLTSLDYHFVADIVDHKRGERIDLDDDVPYQISPSLLENSQIKKINTLCIDNFYSVNIVLDRFPFVRSTKYLLFACFFYEKLKEICLDKKAEEAETNICTMYALFRISEYSVDTKIIEKVEEGIQRKLHRYISQAGLIMEMRNEKKEEEEETKKIEREEETNDIPNLSSANNLTISDFVRYPEIRSRSSLWHTLLERYVAYLDSGYIRNTSLRRDSSCISSIRNPGFRTGSFQPNIIGNNRNLEILRRIEENDPRNNIISNALYNSIIKPNSFSGLIDAITYNFSSTIENSSSYSSSILYTVNFKFKVNAITQDLSMEFAINTPLNDNLF